VACDPATWLSLLKRCFFDLCAEAELIAVEYAASDGGVFVIDETGAGEALLGPSGAARLNSLAVNSSGV
jgi:hypothetical protein